VKLIEVESKEQLLNAVGDRTAMLYYLGNSGAPQEMVVPLEECLAIGKKAGFPVLVDAANMLPPWDNIRKLAQMSGLDLHQRRETHARAAVLRHSGRTQGPDPRRAAQFEPA